MFYPVRNKRYLWQGINSDGKSLSGECLAHSLKQAHNKQTQQGILVTQCKRDWKFKPQQPIKLSDSNWIDCIDAWLYGLSSQLPLITTLQLTLKQPAHVQIRRLNQHCLEITQGGQTLSNALTQITKLDPPWLITCIEAGEHSGKLIDTLLLGLALLQQQRQLKRQLRRATSYPLFLLVMSGILTLVMLTLILPRFASIYEQLNASLPTITQRLIDSANWLSHNSLAVILSITPTAIALVLSAKTETVQKMLANLVCRLPWVGQHLLRYQLARWYGLMHVLLQAQLPIDHALQVSIRCFNLPHCQQWGEHLVDKVRQGHSISAVCSESCPLPVLDIERINLGESTGRLNQAFASLADLHQQHMQRTADTVGRWLEPIILIGLTAVIGGIVLALYTPLFQLGSAIS